MPKFFVTSDIHSFMESLKKVLNEKGFDPTNKDHWLVVCGDCYDRGDDSELVLNYLMLLERKILIRGNHDLLLRDLCKRGFPYRYDFHNGTTTTVYDLGDARAGNDFKKCCEVTQNKLKKYNDLLVNYFETKHFIFCHSWIPTISQNGSFYKYNKNWRKATNKRWELAMWGNPFELADLELNQTGKIIVFGHFHTSYQWSAHYGYSEFGADAKFEPYYGHNYIGLDACVSYTKKVNVIVIEDEFMHMEDKYGDCSTN